MTWPEKHTCHRQEFGYAHWKDSSIRPGGVAINEWRPTEDQVDDDGFPRITLCRTCAYCGGIHPMDFLKILGEETFEAPSAEVPFEEHIKRPHLEFADRKYGYPHKIYIHTRRVLYPDRDFRIGTDFDKKPILRKGFVPHMKFYTIHLDEPEASDEDFLAITTAIEKLTGVSFTRDTGGLKWRCSWR